MLSREASSVHGVCVCVCVSGIAETFTHVEALPFKVEASAVWPLIDKPA